MFREMGSNHINSQPIQSDSFLFQYHIPPGHLVAMHQSFADVHKLMFHHEGDDALEAFFIYIRKSLLQLFEDVVLFGFIEHQMIEGNLASAHKDTHLVGNIAVYHFIRKSYTFSVCYQDLFLVLQFFDFFYKSTIGNHILV